MLIVNPRHMHVVCVSIRKLATYPLGLVTYEYILIELRGGGASGVSNTLLIGKFVIFMSKIDKKYCPIAPPFSEEPWLAPPFFQSVWIWPWDCMLIWE